jgi:quaternary ammonium compound-resistance protein SugE
MSPHLGRRGRKFKSRGAAGLTAGAETPKKAADFRARASDMDWIILLIGSICEVGWLVGMKYADGLTRFWPSVIMVFFMIASVGCLAIALKTIPAGTAYAVWTGGSIAAVAVVGVYLFNEPATPMRLASIALIVVGMVGLRLNGVN